MTNTEPQVQIKIVYCDMDGVIADFAKGVTKIFPGFVEGITEANKATDRKMWAKISQYQKEGGHFWYDLEPMPDAFQLWDYIKKHNVQILTAAGQPHFGAADQKLRWIKHYFGDVVVNVTQTAAQKAQFASPTAVLIDDKRKALDPWEAAGGHGVWHKTAAGSIELLKKLGL